MSLSNLMEFKKDTNFYFAVYDKEDTYEEDECLEGFDTEDEAINFVNEQNAGYGSKAKYVRLMLDSKLRRPPRLSSRVAGVNVLFLELSNDPHLFNDVVSN